MKYTNSIHGQAICLDNRGNPELTIGELYTYISNNSHCTIIYKGEDALVTAITVLDYLVGEVGIYPIDMFQIMTICVDTASESLYECPTCKRPF